LAAPKGEASRIVEDDGAGLAVAPEDPAALAEAVLRLKSDPALRRSLAEGALRAAPRYSRARQAAAMRAVLAMAVAGEGAKAAAFEVRREGHG
jgi:glycosyltransferase involved in cell wall biosynthesis